MKNFRSANTEFTFSLTYCQKNTINI